MRLAALLLSLLCVPISGRQTTWTYAASNHFEVYTTGGEAVARSALEQFGRVHAYFETMLQAPRLTGARTRVVVFSSRQEFEPYAANASVKAFYQSGVDNDVIVLPSLKGDVWPAIVHEYTHLILRRTGSRYPLWLDDGLAEFFSTVTPQNGRLSVGAAPPERANAVGFGVRLMPLERLFAITRESTEYSTPSRAGLFYAQSWALTHMLMTDPRYKAQTPTLLARLNQGNPTALAFAAVYGKPIDEIAKDLTRYCLRGAFRPSVIEIAPTTPPSEVTVRPSTDFEAGVVIAAMLGANPARESQAHRAFDLLEAQNPHDLFFNEAAALFAVRGGRTDDARPYLERAIALGSQNGRIHANYAAILGNSPAHTTWSEDEEDALFAKALTLSPDDVEVRVQMARSLVRRRRGADAVEILAGVTRVPTEYRAVFADAQASARLHSRERVVDARLTNVWCDGTSRVLEVETVAGPRRLIEGPATIGNDLAALLPCGTQDNRAVRIGYEERPDASRRVDGTVLFVTVR